MTQKQVNFKQTEFVYRYYAFVLLNLLFFYRDIKGKYCSCKDLGLVKKCPFLKTDASVLC